MSLTNIRREPRREITESVVGLVIVAVPIWADYRFARWFEQVTVQPNNSGCPWPLGMLLGLFVALVFALMLILTHGLGTLACDALQNLGLHLRPRARRG